MQTTTTRAALLRAALSRAALPLLLLTTTTVRPLPRQSFPCVNLSAWAFLCRAVIGSCQLRLDGQSMDPAGCS